MTPPQKTEPSPTLLELLEDEAVSLEARAEGELDAVVAADLLDRADHLDAAAQRLREEMECDRPDCLSCRVLARINAGPATGKREP